MSVLIRANIVSGIHLGYTCTFNDQVPCTQIWILCNVFQWNYLATRWTFNSTKASRFVVYFDMNVPIRASTTTCTLGKTNGLRFQMPPFTKAVRIFIFSEVPRSSNEPISDSWE